MKLNRGCGCMLLGLALLNAVLLLFGIVGMATGDISIAMGVTAVLLWGANLVASLLLGIAGVRRQPLRGTEGRPEAVEPGAEGEDEELDDTRDLE